MNISKELLSEVLNVNVQTEIQEDDFCSDNTLIYWEFDGYHNDYKNINIYELAFKNLKEWAKLKSVFDIIDWSEEPEQIFKKAEELRNEIN